ncbi:3-phosphoshikimate 1-carboxyvinyltransferase [bacterium]|nr:3-phosphoshikimate 1-carboxyvinyltransferase [bacterium]MBQ9246934.1 3-phosphoshikimate 1-carboxyvinyltransferase [bacterium]
MQKTVSKAKNALQGEIIVPSDKSISHRAIIFSSLACGKSTIKNFSDGQDPKSTLNIFKKLGVEIEQDNDCLTVISNGKLNPSSNILDCGNSGTTMRLLAGVLAGQNFNSVLSGDLSLSNRPMKRIIEPLSLMGAKIDSDNYKAPLKIYGRDLNSIDYKSKISSAQVKSCVLLAGLNTKDFGVTKFTEPYLSRNHTELMLKSMGADIISEGTSAAIRSSKLEPIKMTIPGDVSSAAFFIAAGLIVPNSKIILRNVGLNPTRTGIIEVAKQMGGNIKILDKREVCGEYVGDIQVEYSELHSCEISGEIIPKLIDEIPVLAVLATQAQGETIIKDAQDLRNKESDRIKTIVSELKKLGADIEETEDGMIIRGKLNLKGGHKVRTYNDHRIAMSLYVAGLICEKEILINEFEWVNISFPEFEYLIEKLNNK